MLHITMKTPNKNYIIALIISLVLILLFLTFFIAFFISQVISLKIAHSSFENYYNFRGCTELINKTDTYGFCKTQTGETIKLVKYQDRWFLDGDLPCGFLCF